MLASFDMFEFIKKILICKFISSSFWHFIPHCGKGSWVCFKGFDAVTRTIRTVCLVQTVYPLPRLLKQIWGCWYTINLTVLWPSAFWQVWMETPRAYAWLFVERYQNGMTFHEWMPCTVHDYSKPPKWQHDSSSGMNTHWFISCLISKE